MFGDELREVRQLNGFPPSDLKLDWLIIHITVHWVTD